MQAAFSVATPTRNALPMLRRCVGSVRGQAGVQIEHLVQDAASTDGTPQWMLSQGLVNGVSEPDGGMYDAIQRAWARASGQVLCWLNADEQYLPGTLDVVRRWFDDHPDVDVLFGNYIVVAPDGRAIACRREIPFRAAYVANGFLYAQSCTLFFRRRLWDRGLLRFDTTMRYAADHDLMLRLHHAGVRISHVERYLSLFGVDGNNLSGHAGMLSETAAVQQRHGAYRGAWARQAVFAGRRVERFFRGAYRREALSYRFAVDEVPNYETHSIEGVGGRYSLADARERTWRFD